MPKRIILQVFKKRAFENGKDAVFAGDLNRLHWKGVTPFVTVAGHKPFELWRETEFRQSRSANSMVVLNSQIEKNKQHLIT